MIQSFLYSLTKILKIDRHSVGGMYSVLGRKNDKTFLEDNSAIAIKISNMQQGSGNALL